MPGLMDKVLHRPSQSYADPSGSKAGGGGSVRGSVRGGGGRRGTSTYAPSQSSYAGSAAGGMSDVGGRPVKQRSALGKGLNGGLSRSYAASVGAAPAAGDANIHTFGRSFSGGSKSKRAGALGAAPADLPNALTQKSLLQGDMRTLLASAERSTSGGGAGAQLANSLGNGYTYAPASGYAAASSASSAPGGYPHGHGHARARSVAGGAVSRAPAFPPIGEADAAGATADVGAAEHAPPPPPAGEGGLDGRGTWGPIGPTADAGARAASMYGGGGAGAALAHQQQQPLYAPKAPPSAAGSVRSRTSWFSSFSRSGRKAKKEKDRERAPLSALTSGFGQSSPRLRNMSVDSGVGLASPSAASASAGAFRGAAPATPASASASTSALASGAPLSPRAYGGHAPDSPVLRSGGSSSKKKWWQRKSSQDDYLSKASASGAGSPRTPLSPTVSTPGREDGPGVAGLGAAFVPTGPPGSVNGPPPLPPHSAAELRQLSAAGSTSSPSRKSAAKHAKQAAQAAGIAPLGAQPASLTAAPRLARSNSNMSAASSNTSTVLPSGPPPPLPTNARPPVPVALGSAAARWRSVSEAGSDDVGNRLLARSSLGDLRSTRTAGSTAGAGVGGSLGRRAGGSSWNSFMSSVAGSDIAKTWERPEQTVVGNVVPPGVASRASRRASFHEAGTVTGYTPGSTATGVNRRRSVVERVRKELQGDAQYDLMQTEAGQALEQGDLLARAANAIVGAAPSQVSLPESAEQAEPITRALSPGLVLPRNGAPPQPINDLRVASPPPRVLSPEPARAAPASPQQQYSPHAAQPQQPQQQQQQHLAAPADADLDRSLPPTPQSHTPVIAEGSEESSEEESSEEDDSDETSSDEDHKREGAASPLGVLAEESEDGSGSESGEKTGQAPLRHDEMRRPIVIRPSQRYAAFDAVLKRSTALNTRPADSIGLGVPLVAPRALFADQPQAPPSPDENPDTPVAKSAPSPEMPPAKAQPAQEEAHKDLKQAPAEPSLKHETSQETLSAPSERTESVAGKSVAFAAAEGPSAEKADGQAQRLSDVSLGTSFRASAVMNGHGAAASRSSSRLSHSSSESGDPEVRLLAKAEQDRLRSMKLGEEFFGPSLTSILDSFGVKDIDDDAGIQRAVQTVSAAATPAEGQRFQEVINSVRQQRRSSADAASELGALAPSIAAAWLLGESNDLPAVAEIPHSESSKTVTAGSASFNDLFKAPTGVEPEPQPQKASVLDRPRQKKAKAPEAAEGAATGAEEKPADLVNAGGAIAPEPTKAAAGDDSTAADATVVMETAPQPAETKAPIKSAMKPGKQKPSLADTLVSFPPSKSEPAVPIPVIATQSAPRSPPFSPRSLDAESSAGGHSDVFVTPQGTPADERQQDLSVPGGLAPVATELPVSSPVRRKSSRRSDKPSRKASKRSVQSVSSTEDEGNLTASASRVSLDTLKTAESDTQTVRDVKLDTTEPVPPVPAPPQVAAPPATIPYLLTPSTAVPIYPSTFGAAAVPGSALSGFYGAAAVPGSALPASPVSPVSAVSSAPFASSSSSAVSSHTSMSTGPSPPASVPLDELDKRLPMPPPADFEGQTAGADRTPLAGPPPAPQALGIHLIPPTPPALESRSSYGLASAAPTGALAVPLAEEGDADAEPATQRLRPSPELAPGYGSHWRSETASTGSASPARSAKSGSPSPRQYAQAGAAPVAAFMEPPSSRRNSLAPSSASASASSLSLHSSSPAPPSVPSKDLREGTLQKLSLPGTGTTPSSSASSDSPLQSPAPSAFGGSTRSLRHSASSSEISPSPSPGPYGRKMRQSSHGALGSGRPMMDAINEWESSAPTTPARIPVITPGVPSYATRSVSSVDMGASPEIVKHGAIGGPVSALLGPSSAPSRRSLDSLQPPSLDGHSQLHAPSEYSDAFESQSFASLPTGIVPYKPKDPRKMVKVTSDMLHTRTTMTSIAIASTAKRDKRRSGSSANGGAPQSVEELREQLMSARISLTAHTAPPRKISSTQVLVQVIAVAIDEIDRMIVREKALSESGAGFVPGRSFCGRVVELGWEVKDFRKGDVVFGLQEAKKCGALAEFMTINRYLVAKAPEDCLTTEQIAALPSTGVMAFQIMRDHCSELPRGSRVLILNAHDGVGLLAMQECAGLGLIIVAQCPPTANDGYAICQANGAHEVIVGEPLWAINSLHESSFDLVLDTIGGRKLYDASRRILSDSGEFVTCFGDEHAMANPNLRSHLRSLRRAFFKKDRKNIGYEWVGADSGEDCREALDAVRRAAEAGHICPRLGSILAMEDGPRAFDPVLRVTEDAPPGAVVVRVS